MFKAIKDSPEQNKRKQILILLGLETSSSFQTKGKWGKRSFHLYFSPGANTAEVCLIPPSPCWGRWVWTAELPCCSPERDWGGGRNHGWQGLAEKEWSYRPSCLSKTEGFPETRKVLGTLECWVTFRGWRNWQEWLLWGELSRSRVNYPKLWGEPGLWNLAWSPQASVT